MVEKKFGLSRAMLKNIACISMLCDHIGYYWLYPMAQSEGSQMLEVFVSVLRLFGRLAFPMFAFFLAEGMHYTKSRSRYLIRLAVLFFVSEIPYNLASSNHIFAYENQNVLCSLFFAGVGICLYDFICEKVNQKILRDSLAVVVCIICMAICFVLRAEYAMLAPILTCIFYIYRFQSVKMFSYGTLAILITTFLSAAFMPFVDGGSLFSVQNALDDCLFELPAILALPILNQYGGEKGRALSPMFYYLFYPCHLFLIFFIFTFLA